MSGVTIRTKCIRPFQDAKCSKELRKLSDGIVEKLKTIGFSKASQLTFEFRICSSCRIRVDNQTRSTSNVPTTETIPEVFSFESITTIPSVPSVTSIEAVSVPVNIEIFNNGISGIQVSPINVNKINLVKYSEKKSQEISENVRKNLFNLKPSEKSNNEFEEIICNMKKKYSDPAISRKEKLLILSMLPTSWTVQKIMNDFEANRYIVTEARNIDKIGTSDFPKTRSSGTGLSGDTKELVLSFFEDDDVSRVMPGQKDYVSVQIEGKRQAVQKRLLMTTLREAYKFFCNINPDVIIGFSSFASLRPKQCKLLTSSGTHNVCVCTTHENVNLILHSFRKNNIISDLKTFTDSLLCKTKAPDCKLRNCDNCPSLESLESSLLKQFEENNIECITFEQWITTDRCDIETLVKPVDDFIPFFTSKLNSLIPHDFVKTEQSSFLNKTKTDLKDGEFLVICDFSENYSFVLQDEVQSHHWNVQQATIHPFVIYFNEGMETKHFSFVVISEDLRHDSVAVNLFISKMILFLRTQKSKNISKIFFMSDGAASQYKNRKKNSSLCKFKTNYGIDVEWHFFATSHGKGPCDAIGGTIKRMATRASLAKEREHPIKNARELFDWANNRYEESLTKLEFCFVSTNEYDTMALQLNDQYNQAKAIKGTQKFHAFIPVSETTIRAKLYSNCKDAYLFKVVK